ncbi:hypothetical protein VJ282_32955 [Bacillus mycoides]
MPLTYLVALGVTSEEDVQSYITLKERGIDMGGMMEDAKNNTWDDVYAREIVSGEEPYPMLRDVHGNPVSYEDVVAPVSKPNTYVRTEEPKEPLNIKVMGQPEQVTNIQPEAPQPVKVNDVTAEDEVASTIEEVTKQGTAEQDTGWEERLAEIMSEAETNAKHEKEDERLEQEEAEREPEEVVKPRVKHVFILAETASIPKIEGYEFSMVKGVQDFNNFTAYRDNLLVITQQVPKRLANHFLNWLQGVMASGDKYRVVTLKTSAVPHELVEAEISLTQEDLDSYYGKKDAKCYVGTGVGSFMDISSKLSMEE